MRFNQMLQIFGLAAGAALWAVIPARADTASFDVSLNTSALSGTQTLAFGFTDGDGAVDNNITLSGFSFGGGTALGTPTYVGAGVSGDLTAGVALNDSDFSSLFTQQFTAGSTLSFLMTTTNNFAGGTPDAFAMYVCDALVSTCYSDDQGTGAMLTLNLLGSALSPSSFTLNGASDQNLPAPLVTTPSTNVPEPASVLLLGFGLALLGLMTCRRWGCSRLDFGKEITMNINRLKLVTRGMLALAAITLWANCVKADQVVYSQPLQSPLVDAGGLYTNTGNFQTADTFTLTQGASITSLQWWGSYENGNTVGYPTATATSFVLVIGPCLGSDCLSNDDFGDIVDDGFHPLFPMSFSPSMAHETFLGTSTTLNLEGEIPTASSNYGYQVNFPVPVQLSSGEYFLSILPQLSPGDADWSFDAGTGGDGISQGLNPTLHDNFDLAFTLRGTPTPAVPEPASLLLLAIGLAFVCLLALRARHLSAQRECC